MDLPSIVRKPSWKQLLCELVVSEKLDPWDIDITRVADAFFGMVRSMEKTDFHIPANIILACAILLKYKSNSLRVLEEQEMAPEEEPPALFEEEGGIPRLQIRARIPPKAHITLNELISEMERVIKYDDEERIAPKLRAKREIVEINIPDYDIEKEMGNLYSKMEGEADSEGLVLFSSLVSGNTPSETVLTLAPLLHLAQEKAVGLRQDSLWGEIFIKVNGWSPGA
jgi:segregation and condensation protein A